MTGKQIPFTLSAAKVLQVARQEAVDLGNDYIGSEHILLGLLREEGLAGRLALAALKFSEHAHDTHTNPSDRQ